MYQFLHEQKKGKEIFSKTTLPDLECSTNPTLVGLHLLEPFLGHDKHFWQLTCNVSHIKPFSGIRIHAGSSDLRYSFCPILRKRVLQPRIHLRPQPPCKITAHPWKNIFQSLYKPYSLKPPSTLFSLHIPHRLVAGNKLQQHNVEGKDGGHVAMLASIFRLGHSYTLLVIDPLRVFNTSSSAFTRPVHCLAILQSRENASSRGEWRIKNPLQTHK